MAKLLGGTRIYGTAIIDTSLTVTSGPVYSQGVLVTSTSTGIGYTTGAGNTTTQATSRTTAVTVNGLSGYVALFSAAGSTSVASFQVNNPSVLASDVVIGKCPKEGCFQLKIM